MANTPTVAADLAPAISVDYVSKLHENINSLNKVLTAAEMQQIPAGSTVNIYKTEADALEAQVAENALINATKVSRALAGSITMTLKKYRKQTSAESIQKVGYDIAINNTDKKIIKKVQGAIRDRFYTALNTGTGTASGTNLQTALADLWGKLAEYYEDMDATPIYFINPTDVSNYLGTANISTQTAFGFNYIEGFLGLGDAIISPKITATHPIATAKENLIGYYSPVTGDVGTAFGLTSDESGLVGMKHYTGDNSASFETLILECVAFAPEFADGVFKATISAT